MISPNNSTSALEKAPLIPRECHNKSYLRDTLSRIKDRIKKSYRKLSKTMDDVEFLEAAAVELSQAIQTMTEEMISLRIQLNATTKVKEEAEQQRHEMTREMQCYQERFLEQLERTAELEKEKLQMAAQFEDTMAAKEREISQLQKDIGKRREYAIYQRTSMQAKRVELHTEHVAAEREIVDLRNSLREANDRRPLDAELAQIRSERDDAIHYLRRFAPGLTDGGHPPETTKARTAFGPFALSFIPDPRDCPDL